MCIKNGVKQGDPLSSLTFNCTLEEIFRKMNWEEKGVKINGEYLNNLRFTDDVILMVPNLKELKDMIGELSRGAREAGLEINLQKSKIITSENKEKMLGLEEGAIEYVDETIYLRQLMGLKT